MAVEDHQRRIATGWNRPCLPFWCSRAGFRLTSFRPVGLSPESVSSPGQKSLHFEIKREKTRWNRRQTEARRTLLLLALSISCLLLFGALDRLVMRMTAVRFRAVGPVNSRSYTCPPSPVSIMAWNERCHLQNEIENLTTPGPVLMVHFPSSPIPCCHHPRSGFKSLGPDPPRAGWAAGITGVLWSGSLL